MRPQGHGSGSTVTMSVTSSRISGWTRLCRLVTSSRAPGCPAGTGLAVGVDVLDESGVLEEVDALVVLALGAEEPLGAAVEVEGPHLERVLTSCSVISGVRSSAAVTRIRGEMCRRPACCSSASHMAIEG